MDLRWFRRYLAALQAISSLILLTSLLQVLRIAIQLPEHQGKISITRRQVASRFQPTAIPRPSPPPSQTLLITPSGSWRVTGYANPGSPSVFSGPSYVCPGTLDASLIYTGAGAFGNVQGTVTLEATVFGDKLLQWVLRHRYLSSLHRRSR